MEVEDCRVRAVPPSIAVLSRMEEGVPFTDIYDAWNDNSSPELSSRPMGRMFKSTTLFWNGRVGLPIAVEHAYIQFPELSQVLGINRPVFLIILDERSEGPAVFLEGSLLVRYK